MRLTIIKDDNRVMVDGVGYEVDCSSLPADVHAVQWDGSSGEIEYRMTRCDHCGARSKKVNEFIRDVAPYAPLVEAWKLAKTVADTDALRLAAERAQANAARSQG